MPTGASEPPGAPYFDYAAYVSDLNFGRKFMEKENAWVFDWIIRCCGHNLRSLIVRHSVARKLRSRGLEIAYSCPNLKSLTYEHDDFANMLLIPDKPRRLRELHLYNIFQASKSLLDHVCRMFFQELEAFSFNCGHFTELGEEVIHDLNELHLWARALQNVRRLKLTLPEADDSADTRFLWRVALFEIIRNAQYQELYLEDLSGADLGGYYDDNIDEPLPTRADLEGFEYRLLSEAPIGIVTPTAMRVLYSLSGDTLRSLTVIADGITAPTLRGLSTGCRNLLKLHLHTNSTDDWQVLWDELPGLAKLRDLTLIGFPEANPELIGPVIGELPPLNRLVLRLTDAVLDENSEIWNPLLKTHSATLEQLTLFVDMNAKGISRVLRRIAKFQPAWSSRVPHPDQPTLLVPPRTKLQFLLFDFEHNDTRYQLSPWMRKVAGVFGDSNSQDPYEYDRIMFRGEQLRRALFASDIRDLGEIYRAREDEVFQREREEERRIREAKQRLKDRQAGKNKGAAPTPSPEPEKGSDDDEDELDSDDTELSDVPEIDDDEEDLREDKASTEDGDADDRDTELDEEVEATEQEEYYEAEEEEEIADAPAVQYDSDGREIMSEDGEDFDSDTRGQDEAGFENEQEMETEEDELASSEDELAPKVKRQRTGKE